MTITVIFSFVKTLKTIYLLGQVISVKYESRLINMTILASVLDMAFSYHFPRNWGHTIESNNCASVKFPGPATQYFLLNFTACA